MAGVTDPREEEVAPIIPDFSVTEDFGEVGATYEATLLSLLEVFYKEYEDVPPDELYSTIDKRSEQLYKDILAVIMAFLPLIALIGISEAIDDIVEKINFEGIRLSDKELSKLTERLMDEYNVKLQYPIKEQKLTAKGIVDEVKNDLKVGAFYAKNRIKSEPNYKVKVGNVISRAVKRTKRMITHGVMSAYNEGKRVYYSNVYTKGTLYDWITMRDPKVCKFCAFFEMNGPYTLEELPPCPYHLYCRCTFRPSEKSKFRKPFIDIVKSIVSID